MTRVFILIVKSAKLSAFLAAIGLLIVPYLVNAVSCECSVSVTQNGEEIENRRIAPPPRNPEITCLVNIAAQDCNPRAFNLPEKTEEIINTLDVLTGAAIEIKSKVTRYSCKAYRDDQCQIEAFKQIDPNSKFNPCWTQEQCQQAGGEIRNSDKCGPYNNQPTYLCMTKPPDMPLQIGIPGVTDKFCSIADKDGKFKSCTDLGASCGEYGVCRPGIKGGFPGYLAAFYKFFIAALAVCAIVMVMWGGFKRIMAAGSPELIRSANETIIGAITGVVIALLSYSLLNLVNPKLVENTGISIPMVKSEQYSNKCPDKNPYNPNESYQCGEMAVIDGHACIGQTCPESTPKKGCYKINDNKDTRKAYSCLTPQEACEVITRDTAESVHKLKRSDITYSYAASFNTLCNRYSAEGVSKCVALIDRTNTTPGTRAPFGTRCTWLTSEQISNRCSTAANCDSFDGNLQDGNGHPTLNYAFCHNSLCGFPCKVNIKGSVIGDKIDCVAISQ